ncbi:MAG: hypothetical protein HC842_07420, partial [Cytophagales bacterium]|nr:hypothetical protein [Cytophagales bacterium]
MSDTEQLSLDLGQSETVLMQELDKALKDDKHQLAQALKDLDAKSKAYRAQVNEHMLAHDHLLGYAADLESANTNLV